MMGATAVTVVAPPAAIVEAPVQRWSPQGLNSSVSVVDAWLHDVVPEAYEAVAPARGPSQHSLGCGWRKEKGAAHIELVSVGNASAVRPRVEDGGTSSVHSRSQDRGPVVAAGVSSALPRRGREHNAASRGQVVAHERLS